MPDAEVELIALRTATVEPGPAIELTGGRGGGTRLVGPRVVALPGATCWIADGWSGLTDDAGTLVLERSA